MITRSINLKIPSQLVTKPYLLPLSKYRAIPNIDPNDYLLPRHIGPSLEETEQMLRVCSAKTIDELVKQSIPAGILDPKSLDDGAIGEPVPEHIFLDKFRQAMNRNKKYKTYLGCGFYPSIIPSVIQRNLLENPGWYTAYTPYQAEISQGRLQSLINYQTMVQELTNLQISNASLLDEASAGGEAFFMAYNIHDGTRKKFFVDEYVFMPTIAVIQTKAKYLDIEIVVGRWKDFLNGLHDPKEYCGIIVQTPDSDGILTDYKKFFSQINEIDDSIVKIVASDLLALTLTKGPGLMGADICFGSSQRLGVPMGFGGPYSGFFATKKKNVRKMPGRIIGISKDSEGNLAYRMALQTREQHIRRQKATSNICTAQALLANISAMYAVYHGPKGLREISERINNIAQIVERVFIHYGFQTLTQKNKSCEYFDTITVIACDAHLITKAFLDEKINIRMNDDTSVSLSFSQITKQEDIIEIIEILAKFTESPIKPLEEFDLKRRPFHENLARPLDFMGQQIFNQIHSESQMLRYLRHLQEKDISLDRSMIPLGSCTMKLNASTEMAPLTWPQLNIHPFIPHEQAEGYITLLNELRGWLKSITKLDEISFQPNSGATGEYAGLVTINRYFRSIGQENRKLCLIPKSAHGTNPASANLAGMKVVPIEVEEGKIDLKDFKMKVEKHKKDIGVLMITFPSTAGRYEETIHEMTDIIHRYGGQVYMDGANMNAQVGYTSPGFLGADVCHLNLHKTFAIPHGGGGPGMGPIGVRKHLSPFLPTHPFSTIHNIDTSGTIAVSEYGSASILTISYAYIALLGREGVRKGTAYAILNANYLMNKLKQYYKILYLSDGERCSHEFIIDLNEIKKQKGVTEEDIAKRLMDFGFHAPTMSFPVPGTLMIEPTESEDKAQLDRFAEAMIKIHSQINTMPEILKFAPYTASYLMKSQWDHKFTREEAAFPLPWVKSRGKFWPSVGRVSNPYGDRNLICNCPDISSYL